MGKYGHHADPLTDAELEIARLEEQLAEAQRGLLRALDYRAATPEGVAIKDDVRETLWRTGFFGSMGEMGAPITPG